MLFSNSCLCIAVCTESNTNTPERILLDVAHVKCYDDSKFKLFAYILQAQLMRISSKGEYGLRALFDLAQHYGEGLVQSDDIANRQGIPVNYLNQMLILLRRAGIIESLRGPQGGHMLARPPDQITLLDALTVLEGPLMPSDATRDDLVPTNPDDREVMNEVWDSIRTTLEKSLRNITLEDLCQRKHQRAGHMMYYI